MEHAITCLKNGADPAGLESNSGRTGLMKAAFWGHDHVVGHLLNELKVDVNVQDANGETALHDAARFGHKGVAVLLVDGGADTSLENEKGQTALQVAQEYDQPDVVALLSAKK